MIRRGTKVQLAVFALITLLGVSYVGAHYAGLGRLVHTTGDLVSADFAQSGGIFVNAEVTYRGVGVGRVERMRLSPDGVRVDLRIKPGARVPADTRAVVADRSAVGEQFVDLQPRRSGGPFLHDGSRIPRADTETPLPTETLLLNLDRLVGSVDRADLATVIDELGRAFAGSGKDLQTIIDAGDALTRTASDNLPQTLQLIHDGRQVLATQIASGGQIRTFARDLALVSETLRDHDTDLRKVLDNGVVASGALESLLRENRATIGTLVANLLTTSQVSASYLPGLEQMLVTYPTNVAGGYTVVPGDGTSHFGLVLNAADPAACTAGYGATRRRSPNETSDVPANRSARCSLPHGSPSDVRGAQNAPGPTGGGSADRVAVTGTTPAQTYAGPPVAGVDPVSGLALAAGGDPLLFGGHGGQAALLGKDSWQWLLLGPLSG
jgi:phospholipid/cholesterol/gamma-HCH transport system substrate-binding protein